MVIMVVASGGMAGIAMAASPTLDTETSNTSQTTDLEDGDTQEYNTSTSSNFSWSADSENSSLEVIQGNETIVEMSPDSYDAADTDTSGSNDTWYYNYEFADDGSDYDGLEADANENVTLTFQVTNDTEAESPDTSNFTVYFQNGEEMSFVNADDVETADTGMFGSFSIPVIGDDNESDSEVIGATRTTETVGVTENTSEVSFDVQSSNLSDSFSESFAEKSSGDLLWASTVSVNGDYVPVYYQSTGDQEWLDDNETYATISSDGSTMTLHNAGESAEDGELEIEAVGNQKLGMTNAQGMLRSYGASGLDVVRLSINAIDFNPFSSPDWGDN